MYGNIFCTKQDVYDLDISQQMTIHVPEGYPVCIY